MSEGNREHQPGVVVRAEDITKAEQSFSHPWNPRSEIVGTRLSQLSGLERCGISLARVAPGKESFVLHNHHYEEEWLYILTGRAVVQIDDQEHQVAAGDFLAFPTPSAAHHLRNPFDEAVVYLMGGENRDFEIADFPELGKRMLRHEGKIEIYSLADAKPFGPL